MKGEILDQRNIITKPRPKQKKDSIIWELRFQIFSFILIFCAFGILYLYLGNKQTQLRYEISRLKRQEIMLKELNRKLRLEISILMSPQRLEKEAKKRFGLIHPKPEQIIRLR